MGWVGMGELGCGDDGMACKGKAPRAVRMDTHLQTEPLFGGPHNHRGFGGVEQFEERLRQLLPQWSEVRAVGLDDLQELDRGHEDEDSTTVDQLDDGAALDWCVLATTHGVLDDAANVGRRTHEHWLFH